MKVVVLRSNPVNPDPRIEKEVNSLSMHGHSVTIVCWDRSGALPKKDFLHLDEVKIPIYRGGKKASFGGGFKSILKLIDFQFFLLRWLLINRSSYEVIHAADFDTVLPAMLMKILFKKKVVYDIFDFYVDAFTVPNILKGIIRGLDCKVINNADAVIITNEARLEQISGAFPKKIVVIHNSPAESSMSTFSTEIQGPVSPYVYTFAYVGILQPGRLLVELLELFANRPEWLFKIAGFGALDEIVKSYASKYNNIQYYGLVQYNDGLKISASADFLFATYDPGVPNHKYSSPNKLYEAMLLSKPIIVCKNTGIDIIVDNAHIGISINYSAKEFEKVVDVNLAEIKTRSRMGERSKEIFLQHYSWEIMEGRLVELYNNI